MIKGPALSALALLVAAGAIALGGCGGTEGAGEGGFEEAHREGLALPLGGLTYNVFLTRQLNLADPEDMDYVDLDEAPPGMTYYGVFMQVCNPGDEPDESAADLRVHDTQGDVFEPLDISDSVFAYESKIVEPGQCIPTKGSIADMGPAGGALLVFELSLEAAENRPLELEISEGAQASEPAEALRIELDI
jgi:hypothetical protein